MHSYEYGIKQELSDELRQRRENLFTVLNQHAEYKQAATAAFQNGNQQIHFVIGKTDIRLVNDQYNFFLQTQTPTQTPNHFDSWFITIGADFQIAHKTVRHEGSEGILLGGISVKKFDLPDNPQEALRLFSESLKKPATRRKLQSSNPLAVA